MALTAAGHVARRGARVANLLAFLVAAMTAVGLLIFVTGAMPRPMATVALLAPGLAAVATLRPGWLLLGLILLPMTTLNAFPVGLVPYLPILPLVALMLRDFTFDLRLRSGAWTFIGIVVLALTFTADVSSQPTDMASGHLKLLIYYGQLVLLAYTAVRTGEVEVPQLVAVLLLSICVNTGLELLTGTIADPVRPGEAASFGRLTSYLMGMGVVIGVGRALGERRPGRLSASPVWNLAIVAFLGLGIVVSEVRGAWVATAAGLIVVIIASRRYEWLVAIPLVVVALVATVPNVADTIDPDEFASVNAYTTGRANIWTLAYGEVESQLPAGNGWGAWWATDAADRLPGFASTTRAGNFVHMHNDFLLLLFELGVAGALLYLALWGQVGTAVVRAMRGPPAARRAGAILGGAVVVFLVMQLNENGFALRAIAERFFVVIGALLGVAAAARDRAAALAAEARAAWLAAGEL